MPHAANIEWLWLAAAVVGFVFKVNLTLSARRNYLRQRHNYGVDLFMATSIYRHMLHMLLVFLLSLLAAWHAVRHAPPPPSIEETQSYVVAIFFALITIVLTGHAVFVARWWGRLRTGRYNGEDPRVLQLPVVVKTTITDHGTTTQIKAGDEQPHTITDDEDEAPSS